MAYTPPDPLIPHYSGDNHTARGPGGCARRRAHTADKEDPDNQRHSNERGIRQCGGQGTDHRDCQQRFGPGAQGHPGSAANGPPD